MAAHSPSRSVPPRRSRDSRLAHPAQLDLEHTSSNIQVTLATGANPTGADFTHVLVPTLAETGPQAFCIGGVTVPSALVAPGDYGTLLVATNAHGSGGLYNCADVVFVREAMAAADYAAHCSNSTGVAAQAWGSAAGNANGTAAGVVATGTTSAASAASSTVRSRAAVGNRPRGLALVVGVGVSLLVMGAVG